MSTEEAFVINYGHYNEEADDSEDTIIRYADDEWLSVDPPLGSCTVTDILELAEWITSKKEE